MCLNILTSENKISCQIKQIFKERISVDAAETKLSKKKQTTEKKMGKQQRIKGLAQVRTNKEADVKTSAFEWTIYLYSTFQQQDDKKCFSNQILYTGLRVWTYNLSIIGSTNLCATTSLKVLYFIYLFIL